MKKLIYIIPLLFSMGLVSCEDAIELYPKSKLPVEDYFNTEQDLQLFSNYFYNNMLSNAMDNNPAPMVADDNKPHMPLPAILKLGQSRTIPASGGGWSWGGLRRVNTLLEYIDNCRDKKAVNKYSAVARFFRAYFYFEKVKRFGDVPWIDRQLGFYDDQLYAPRDSREFIMQKMLQDIDFAIANLPTSKDEASAPYRLTKGAALALKSNFCLYEGTFRKYHNLTFGNTIKLDDGEEHPVNTWEDYLKLSVDASEKLMSGNYGKYDLYSTNNPESDYQNLFSAENANKTEYILAVKYNQALSIRHNANAYTVQATQGQPGYTRKFVCSYLMKDGSRYTDQTGWETKSFVEEMANRDPRLSQSIRGLGYHRIGDPTILAPDLTRSKTGYQPTKFVTASQQTIGKNTYNQDNNNMTTSDLPEYRYAETLLNYAEAKAELGSLSQADLDKSVNLIRKRAGLTGMLKMADANANPDPYLDGDISPESGYFNVTGENKGVILEIRRERSIELVQEGRRWDDIMRWKCGKCLDTHYYGLYFPGAGSYDLSGDDVPDLILITKGSKKPNTLNDETVLVIGEDIYLSNETSGYVDGFRTQERNKFNEGRDYLYPIPYDELSLNPNLVQNPGW